MSFLYTPTPSNNPASVTLPSDGDLASALSVDSPLGDLADKVAHANWPETDTTKSYPLASQTISRSLIYNAVPQMTDGSGTALTAYVWAYELDVWIQIDVAVASRYIDVEIDVPHECTLNSINVNMQGATGARTHASLPGVMPTYRVFRKNVGSGVTTAMSSLITDGSATVGVYNGVHETPITITSGNPIDKINHRYYVRIIGESGANSVASALALVGVTGSWTATLMDKGAS